LIGELVDTFPYCSIIISSNLPGFRSLVFCKQVIPQDVLLVLVRKSRFLIARKVRRSRNAAGTQLAERASRRKRRPLKLKKPKMLKLARMQRRPLMKMLRRTLMWR